MTSETAEKSSDDQMTGVTDPRDTDVLCGRGGAALRHPGNQTYRRLVNLNKGLYITCLKTEKLKISRSIVAAIREQKGRFLEKNAKDGTWCDIGDKKAIEKTSQALRENQPKLRQKIVEMGGGVAGTAAFMESQYGQQTVGQQGIYNPQEVGLRAAVGLDATSRGNSQTQIFRPHEMQTMQPPPPVPQSGSRLSLGSAGSLASMHSLDRFSVNSMQSLSVGPSMQSLMGQSITSIGGHSAGITPMISMEHGPQPGSLRSFGGRQRVQQLRPSLVNRDSRTGQELGIPLQQDSNLSLMSEFSQFNGFGDNAMAAGSMNGMHAMAPPPPMGSPSMSNGSFNIDNSFRNKLAGMSLPVGSGRFAGSSAHQLDNTSTHSMDVSSHNPLPLTLPIVMESEGNPRGGEQPGDGSDPVDRREILRKMKYTRPPSEKQRYPSQSQQSLTDGLGDFNMVESSNTLVSTLSNMSLTGDKETKKTSTYVPPKPLVDNGTRVETARVIDHSLSNSRHGDILGGSRHGDMLSGSRHGDVLGAGSRHSIMSGMSRISDTSIDQSIFSDLSRKIGNVSTRSLAMSEISAMEMQERLNEDHDKSPRRNIHLGNGLAGVVRESKSSDPPLEFHL